MLKLSGVVLVAVAATLYSCGSSDERDVVRDSAGGEAGQGGAPLVDEPMGGTAGAAGEGAAGGAGSPAVETGGAAGEGGAPSVGGAPSSAGAAGTADGGEPVVLPEGTIVDEPYLCDDTGPFAGVQFDAYFHLDDFDDGTIDLPGLTSSSQTFSSSSGPELIDSVDCDDGVVDGKCANCNALFSGSGALDFTFDAQVLGDLPTHVGMVWTDGGYNATVTFTGYDASDAIIYTETAEGIGDASNYGETEEDRFFGIVSSGGVKRVTISNPGGGIEIDHLQYGR